jgi:hypothetical protein
MGMLDDVKSKNKQKAAENWFKMADGAKTPEKQIEYYTRSLDVNPYNAEAWFRKGRILEKMGNFEEAKRSFDLAIEVDPDYQGMIGRQQPAGEVNSNNAELVESVGSVGSIASSIPDENMIIEESTFSEELTDSFENENKKDFESSNSDAGIEEDVLETEQIDGISFTPPVGDESIFSNIKSEESVDINKSDDIVFSSSVSEVENESISSFGTVRSDESFAEETLEPVVTESGNVTDEKEETDVFSNYNEDDAVIFGASGTVSEVKKPVSISESKPESKENRASAFDNEQAEKLAGAASIPAFNSSSSTDASTKTISKPAAIATSNVATAGQCMEIKIPTNEALKFWAIGVVAMVIAFVIGSVIVN